jgi:hypothetical protein
MRISNRGAVIQAEIKPFEPDLDNAGEGKKKNRFNQQAFLY